MQIKKGTILKINHSRKGEFLAIVDEDFDTEKTEFYPVSLAEGEKDVRGMNTVWHAGENISCRNSLCTVEVIEDVTVGFTVRKYDDGADAGSNLLEVSLVEVDANCPNGCKDTRCSDCYGDFTGATSGDR